MARIESVDGGTYFELTPVQVSRGRGEAHGADGMVCAIRFEAYGEPVDGEANLTHGGLTRMIEKLQAFVEKRQGMMQLRSDTNEVEFSLAAKRSKWTQKINVTGLAGLPPEQQECQEAADELRVSFGVTYRQNSGAAGSVEHRCGMHTTFDALGTFAAALKAEFEAAPTRRQTGKVDQPGE